MYQRIVCSYLQAKFLFIILSFLCFVADAHAAEILRVELQLEEQDGIDRTREPVTFGVPLPLGKVRDVTKLALKDEEGDRLPAAFSVGQRWLDGSLRWLHVHALVSMPALAARELHLVEETLPPAHSSMPPLKASLQENRLILNTGPAKLIFSVETTDLIEAAFYDPAGKFGPETRVVGGFEASSGIRAGGQSFLRIQPGSRRVEILEESAMRVVALLAGQFASETLQMPPSLSFEARVLAYAGSPRVAIDYTVINRTGNSAEDRVELRDLSLNLAVPMEHPRVAIGSLESPVVSNLKTSASIFQDSADHYRLELNQDPDRQRPGKSARTLNTGWMDLRGRGQGLAVGVRDFWQTWPKKLEARTVAGGTLLRVGLYPREKPKAQEIYMGQARTHRINLLLHGGMQAEELAPIMASLNRPLRIVAQPDWYCEETEIYGPIAPAHADYGRFSRVARHYEAIVDESMDRILEQQHEGRTSRGVTRDSYGWMNWGDMFFRVPRPEWGKTFDDPVKNLSWSGNYYDYGFAMLMQFMRSGDRRYLETGLNAGAYTADVFIVHHHPDPRLVGACHYSPPRYHAATDNGEPYISREFNHAKAASVLARWQWLGDWWARQVALEAFNNALNAEGADSAGWRQCRGNGHRLRILWLAYHFTGDEAYQRKAWQLIRMGQEHVRKHPQFDPKARLGQRYMVGIGLEGMILHYWDRPNPGVLKAVKTVVDHALQQNLERYSVNMAMALGFLWEQTGESRYRDAMVELILKARPTDQAKIFGQSFRSTPWALDYLIGDTLE